MLFTLNLGVAVLTESHAALWTDGRYFLKAEQQMDCCWILMRMGTSLYTVAGPGFVKYGGGVLWNFLGM